MQKYNILELNEKLLPELQSIAAELGIKDTKSQVKDELIYKILDQQAISFAGIQVGKEKEREAKRAEKKRGRKPKAAVETTPDSVEEPMTETADTKAKPEKKRRQRVDKTVKSEGDIVEASCFYNCGEKEKGSRTRS